MRIGIGSYTFGWETGTYGSDLSKGATYLTAYELIDRAVRLGTPVVQICVQPPLHEFSEEELRAIAEYALQRGVEIETGTKGNDPVHLRRYLDVSTLVGSRLLRVLITEPSENLREEEAKLREVIADFEAAGVTIAIENHELYRCRDLAELIHRVGSGNLGVCLDTVNSLGRGEGVREVTEVLMPLTVNLHLKDFTIVRGATDMGFSVVGAPQGSGNLETEWLLEQAFQRNPEMTVILEQWTPLSGTVADTIAIQTRWAERGIMSIRETLNKVQGL